MKYKQIIPDCRNSGQI